MELPPKDERWRDAPLAYEACSVDTKGRLKFATEIQRWLEKLDEKLFVTTWDGISFQVYTRKGFATQLEFLENRALVPETKAAAERQMRLGRHFGAEVNLDSDGRITLPQPLRQKLGIEKQNAAFMVGVNRDHFDGIPTERFMATIDADSATMAEDAETMQSQGRR
ncbi:MAG: hypothetical protein NW208_04195 [Bryobacter sp.]|nr:hypothetical protein [Bryobacter sp.]